MEWTSLSHRVSLGGEATPYYIDGVKYLNVAAPEDFGGTIEAFMYPKEFMEYDGSAELYDGFSINLQKRKTFGLSYRTRVGNDVDGIDLGYKLHIIYKVLVAPSSKAYASISTAVDPMNFSWTFTTMPVVVEGNYIPTAHVIIDSTKVSPALVRAVEEHLYGSSARSPKLIDIDKLIYWFESGGEPLELVPQVNGVFEIVRDGTHRDLITTDVEGIYKKSSNSRLTPTVTPPHAYTLET